LNEKRAEVIKIESRFKVNVLMIPNKHLETPHYKLERLRHDDVRLDDQKASYVMAEEAARELEADTVVSRKEGDVKARPEAAVKGITPSQPAPVAQPRPARSSSTDTQSSSGGFFGFIKNLFSSSEPEVKPVPAAPRGRNAQGRDGNRNGGDRGGRNRGRRGERSERSERTERPAGAAPDAASNTEGAREAKPRQEGRGRNRNGRTERPEVARSDADASSTKPNDAPTTDDSNSAADGSDERRGRGRNRRGRGRGQRTERSEGSAEASATVITSYSAGGAWPPSGMAGSSATMLTSELTASFTARKASPQSGGRGSRPPRSNNSERNNGAVQQPSESAAASFIPAAAAPAKPIAVAPVAPAPAPELPKVAFTPLEEKPLQQVLESAGMVWVGTDTAKLAEVQTQIQAEPAPMRAIREPKPPAALPQGPMVLIETGGQEKSVPKEI
jgi:ribonuclease E